MQDEVKSCVSACSSAWPTNELFKGSRPMTLNPLNTPHGLGEPSEFQLPTGDEDRIAIDISASFIEISPSRVFPRLARLDFSILLTSLWLDTSIASALVRFAAVKSLCSLKAEFRCLL